MKYPLEQLTTIKKKKLEEAEKVLQEKKNALIKEQEKLAQVEKERDKVKEHRMAKLTQLREKLDEGGSSDKIQQMKAYLKVVDEQLKQKELKVKEQLKHVEAAEKQVEIARLDFLKKQRDVEKMQMHRKEWEKEMKRFLEQKEAIETDEMGSGMHTRLKRASNHRKKRSSNG
jgi:flagellar biosynthesis chaperone FliJ